MLAEVVGPEVGMTGNISAGKHGLLEIVGVFVRAGKARDLRHIVKKERRSSAKQRERSRWMNCRFAVGKLGRAAKQSVR